MSVSTIQEPQVAFNGSGRGPDRRRVLLFDGGNHAVASAAPALAGLGLDVVVAEPRSAPIAPSADTLVAVVVSRAASDDRETSALIDHLRGVCELPVLLLAPRMQDDVLLQETSEPDRKSGGLVPLEIAHEIRAVLRRAPARVLRYGVLEIDTAAREVRVDGQPVELSRREFDLIAFLASSPGRAFTRRELLDGVWHSSGEWQTPSTVTEHVRRIRLKLQTRPDLPSWVVTVRGTGYRFRA
jgi:DNA-binding response OmpR family regulator